MGRIDNKALVLSLARATFITAATFKASHYIPRSVKWFFIFLVALNLRSFPLLWHYRVVVPWFSGLLKQQLVRKIQGRDVHLKRLNAISPVGKNPLALVESWTSRAVIADCDYNGHLSNSSYAKNIDYCRLNAAVRFYPPFIGLGGHLPIAGTYHMFLKEIPMNADYEILTFLPGWEEHKWSYLTIAFITRPKRGTKDTRAKQQNVSTEATKLEAQAEAAAKELLKGVPNGEGADHGAGSNDADVVSHIASNAPVPASTSASIVIVPPVTEAGTMLSADSSNLTSGIVTPFTPGLASDVFAGTNTNGTFPLNTHNDDGSPNMQEALDAIRLRIPEGATLHAVAVSQYCYKLGRVTIPPRVALIACGFGDPTRKRWERLQQIRDAPDGEKKIKQILRGGWKDREVWGDFWELEEFEGKARKAAEALKQLRTVMGALSGEGRAG